MRHEAGSLVDVLGIFSWGVLLQMGKRVSMTIFVMVQTVPQSVGSISRRDEMAASLGGEWQLKREG